MSDANNIVDLNEILWQKKRQKERGTITSISSSILCALLNYIIQMKPHIKDQKEVNPYMIKIILRLNKKIK